MNAYSPSFSAFPPMYAPPSHTLHGGLSDGAALALGCGLAEGSGNGGAVAQVAETEGWATHSELSMKAYHVVVSRGLVEEAGTLAYHHPVSSPMTLLTNQNPLLFSYSPVLLLVLLA